MKNFWQLLLREFRQIFSNQVVLAIFFAAPIFYGVLMGFVYKKAQADNLPVMVVDLDNSPMSIRIIDAINDNTQIEAACIKYSGVDVKDEFRYDKYVAVVTIPERFEGDLLQAKHPEINVDINTSNILTANYSAKALQVVFGVLNAGIEIEALKKKGSTPQYALDKYEPFKANYTRFFNQSGNYMTFLWPGMMGTVMQQVFLLAVALCFAREFEKKTLGEILKYKYNALQIMILKTVPFLILGTLVWGATALMFPIFKIPLTTSYGSIIFAGFIFTLSMIFLGFVVSIIIPNQLKATEILMVIAAPSFILSGYTWPTYLMPEAVQYFANCIPLTHFLELFRKLTFLNGSLSDAHNEMVALSIIAAVSFAISIVALSFKIKKIKAITED